MKTTLYIAITAFLLLLTPYCIIMTLALNSDGFSNGFEIGKIYMLVTTFLVGLDFILLRKILRLSRA